MATVTLAYTIADSDVNDVVDTIADRLGWVSGNKQTFIKNEIGKYLKSLYKQQKIRVAEGDAGVTASEAADAVVIS